MKSFWTPLAAAALAAGTLLAGSTNVAVAQETFKWRMQSNLAAGEPGYESVRVWMVDNLKAMTNGRMQIELFPVGALFPVKEGLESVGNGIVEIGMMTGGYFSGKLGPIATLESGVPGAERTAMERYAFFYKQGFIDLAREAYGKYNVYYLAPHISPSWDIISKKPIKSAKDFDGLKIRTFGIEAKWYESMGASAVFLGGSEIYTALATDVVDAVRWGSPAVNKARALHEVGKYYIQPSPMPAPNNNILVNSEAWASLPDDLKSAMDAAARMASLDYLARGAEQDAKAMAEMKAAGVSVSTIPPEEWAQMEKKAQALWSAYAKEDELSARAVKMMKEFLAELGRGS